MERVVLRKGRESAYRSVPATRRQGASRVFVCPRMADHPTVGIRLNNLAQIWRNLGQPERARPFTERALAIAEAAYGPTTPLWACCGQISSL